MSLTPYPQHRDLISHHHEAYGEFPAIRHVVRFYYPDCVRVYDGERWEIELYVDEGATLDE